MPNERKLLAGSPRTGRGDLGTTELLFDISENKPKLLLKSDPVLHVQNVIDKYRNAIARFLVQWRVTDETDYQILKGFRDKYCNNLSAAVYCELKSDRYVVEDAVAEAVQERLAVFNATLDDQGDFLTHVKASSNNRSFCQFWIDLDDLRIDCRELEHQIWVVLHGFRDLRYGAPALRNAGFLNMFSDYLNELKRFEAYCHNVKEQRWQGERYLQSSKD